MCSIFSVTFCLLLLFVFCCYFSVFLLQSQKRKTDKKHNLCERKSVHNAWTTRAFFCIRKCIYPNRGIIGPSSSPVTIANYVAELQNERIKGNGLCWRNTCIIYLGASWNCLPSIPDFVRTRSWTISFSGSFRNQLQLLWFMVIFVTKKSNFWGHIFRVVNLCITVFWFVQVLNLDWLFTIQSETERCILGRDK